MANVRTRKLITKLLKIDDLTTDDILAGMKDMKTGRGHKYRNLPTKNQLANILSQAPDFIIVNNIVGQDHNGRTVTLWRLKGNVIEG